jgi:hypothetical protein
VCVWLENGVFVIFVSYRHCVVLWIGSLRENQKRNEKNVSTHTYTHTKFTAMVAVDREKQSTNQHIVGTTLRYTTYIVMCHGRNRSTKTGRAVGRIGIRVFVQEGLHRLAPTAAVVRNVDVVDVS